VFNTTNLRVVAEKQNAAATEDKAITDAYGSWFHTPLDIELVEGHMTFYKSTCGNRLEYKLTFNDYCGVIMATKRIPTRATP